MNFKTTLLLWHLIIDVEWLFYDRYRMHKRLFSFMVYNVLTIGYFVQITFLSTFYIIFTNHSKLKLVF